MSAPPTNPKPLFIAGQYKCGTSWLLAALSAHPSVLGVREIDIVRAAHEVRDGRLTPTSPERRLERFFSGTAWCPEDARPALLAGTHRSTPGPDLSRPRAFADLGQDEALRLYRRLEAAQSPAEAMDAFLAAISSIAVDQTRIALKGAGQIAVLEGLKKWRPQSERIVITRDGRDAALSAQAYKRLMAERRAPWLGGSDDYWRLLKGWARQARLTIERAIAGDVYLLRYEDLSADFAGELSRLLRWLGLGEGTDIVDRIERRTSFEAVTGRPRGTEARAVVRKGAVGEWREALDDSEREAAWRVAGAELEALGYMPDHEIRRLPSGLRVDQG